MTRKDGSFEPYLIVKKSASGYNQPLRMEVPVEIVANKILLPNYVKYPYENRMRDYDVDYELVVPRTTKVIPLNEEQGFSVDDNAEEDDNSTQESSQVQIGSGDKKIVIKSIDDSDSVSINGQTYDKQKADSILKKAMPKNLKDMEKLKDVDIKIKDGKSEISIKTK